MLRVTAFCKIATSTRYLGQSPIAGAERGDSFDAGGSRAHLLDLQYGYDENHDRTYERYGGSSASGDAFEYDKARRLATAWMGSVDVTAPSSSAYTKKIVYTMDGDGNRSSVKVTPYGQSATTTSYTDNSLNQYTAVGGTSRTHDDNGNLTDDGTLNFEYDYKNQLVRVKQDTTTVAEYKYDALGRRVEKYVDGDKERFIYSGHETVSVYDGTNDWIRDFVFGAVIDEVLMLEQADVLDFDSDSNTTETTRSFYHRNALGSVMEITDINEGPVVSYRYDPYGAITITRGGSPQSSDPLGNPWMYTGRFADEETGLYYYRARYYAPGDGRFCQRDPAGYAAGAALYQYVSSAPTMRTDPMGLDELETVGGATGGAVAGAAGGAVAGGYVFGALGGLCGGPVGAMAGVVVGRWVGGIVGGALGGYIGGKWAADDPCECSLQISADRNASQQRNANNSSETDSRVVSWTSTWPTDCDDDEDCKEACEQGAAVVEAAVDAYNAGGGSGSGPNIIGALAGYSQSGVSVTQVRHVTWGSDGYDRSDPEEGAYGGSDDPFWDSAVYGNWRVTHVVWDCD